MNLQNCYLTKNAFICLAGKHYVILDLAADMYLRVEKGVFEALAERTNLSPLLSTYRHESASRALKADPQVLCSELLARGLLTENIDQANARTGESIALPVKSLMSGAAYPGLIQSVCHVCSFAASARVAGVWLRQPISHTVNRIIELKRRQAHLSARLDIDRARALISIFCRLRPFYDRQYLCLFDSLALLIFLAKYDMFPTWVFGVQSDPFAAHCWVQHHEYVLNDTVDRVGVYTPLMAV